MNKGLTDMIECDNFGEDFEEQEEIEMYSDNLDELLEIELAFLADSIYATTNMGENYCE